MPLIDYESDEGQPSNTTAAPELEQEDNEQPDASNPFNIVQSTSSAALRAQDAKKGAANAAPFVLEKVSACLMPSDATLTDVLSCPGFDEYQRQQHDTPPYRHSNERQCDL